MSIYSIVGAASGAIHQAVESAESAVQTAIQPAVESIADGLAPVAINALQQVAMNPQLFGQEVSGIAGLLAETYGTESRGPLLPPGPVGDMISTATSQR
jgi:hypothetical protein